MGKKKQRQRLKPILKDEEIDRVIAEGKRILAKLHFDTFHRYREVGQLIMASGYRKGAWRSEHREKALKEWAISQQTFSIMVQLGEMTEEEFTNVVSNFPSVHAWANRGGGRTSDEIVLRKFDVWNIAGTDLKKPYGDPDYPGAIPGDIVGNVLLWFLPNGGKVVDPMAGGGVTEDVCKALGPKYRALLYDSKPLKNYQYRKSVRFNDIKKGRFPREAQSADLIFADPPYGPLKEYGAEPEELESILKGLAKASREALKKNGLVAVLMQNYYIGAECVGEFVPLIRQTAEIFENFGFHQIFEATVPLHGKVARSEDHMTHIDRRLMVFQVDKSV